MDQLKLKNDELNKQSQLFFDKYGNLRKENLDMNIYNQPQNTKQPQQQNGKPESPKTMTPSVIKGLNDRLRLKEEEIILLREELARMQYQEQKRISLNESETEYQDLITRLTNELTKHEQVISELKPDLNSKTFAMKELETNLSQCNRTNEILREKDYEMSTHMNALRKENQDYLQTINELENKLMFANQKIQDLMNLNGTQKDKDSSNYQGAFNELKSQLIEKNNAQENIVQELLNQKESLMKQTKQLQTELFSMHCELDTARDEINQLKSICDTRQNQIQIQLQQIQFQQQLQQLEQLQIHGRTKDVSVVTSHTGGVPTAGTPALATISPGLHSTSNMSLPVHTMPTNNPVYAHNRPVSQENLSSYLTPTATTQPSSTAKVNSDDPDQDALNLAIMLSQQEADHGVNMYDSFTQSDKPELDRLMRNGSSKNNALLIIFNQKFQKNTKPTTNGDHFMYGAGRVHHKAGSKTSSPTSAMSPSVDTRIRSFTSNISTASTHQFHPVVVTHNPSVKASPTSWINGSSQLSVGNSASGKTNRQMVRRVGDDSPVEPVQYKEYLRHPAVSSELRNNPPIQTMSHPTVTNPNSNSSDDEEQILLLMNRGYNRQAAIYIHNLTNSQRASPSFQLAEIRSPIVSNRKPSHEKTVATSLQSFSDEKIFASGPSGSQNGNNYPQKYRIGTNGHDEMPREVKQDVPRGVVVNGRSIPPHEVTQTQIQSGRQQQERSMYSNQMKPPQSSRIADLDALLNSGLNKDQALNVLLDMSDGVKPNGVEGNRRSTTETVNLGSNSNGRIRNKNSRRNVSTDSLLQEPTTDTDIYF